MEPRQRTATRRRLRRFVDDAARLERLREVIRLRHYAKSTEKTYLHWNRRFLVYRRETGAEGEPTAADAKAFLTHLAMVEKVSASTQNQAFSALAAALPRGAAVDLEEMAQTVRAKRGPKLPTVLSVAEVQRLLAAVEPRYALDGEAALREWAAAGRAGAAAGERPGLRCGAARGAQRQRGQGSGDTAARVTP